MKLLLALLFLDACAFSSSEPAAGSSIESVASSSAEPIAPEPFWGRIYLRHGVAPIQYFRDTFGGAMPAFETEFRFPSDQRDNRFGCEPLGSDEYSNRSVVLVVDRGECSFEHKARVAEAAGAAALVVVGADDSVTRPMAQVDVGEIEIPTVMVRRSAGELLRATVLGADQRVFGRLLPMECTKSPYTCAPRTVSERAYIDDSQARSGVLLSTANGSVIGEFLASRFGGVMPERAVLSVSALLHSSVVCQNSDTEEMPRLDGKVALIAGSGAEPGCSVADMVTRAQHAGAIAALIVTDSSGSVSTHPSVVEDWLGYNVTIFSGVVSSSTMLQIVKLQEQTPPALGLVHFALKNEIADAWEQILELSMKSAWPVRKDRKEKLVKRLLEAFALNEGQMQMLKSHFLTVAGGSVATWDLLTQKHADVSGGEHVGQEESLTAKATGSIASPGGSHEEL